MQEEKINYILMQERAQNAADFLKLMAHPVRLQILCRLIEAHELNAGDIGLMSGLSQSATSQHLTLMRKAALIASHRKGNEIFYTITDMRVSSFIANIYELFCKQP